MFESLTDKLTNAMRQLRGTAKLSEDNMAEALITGHKARDGLW